MKHGDFGRFVGISCKVWGLILALGWGEVLGEVDPRVLFAPHNNNNEKPADETNSQTNPSENQADLKPVNQSSPHETTDEKSPKETVPQQKIIEVRKNFQELKSICHTKEKILEDKCQETSSGAVEKTLVDVNEDLNFLTFSKKQLREIGKLDGENLLKELYLYNQTVNCKLSPNIQKMKTIYSFLKTLSIDGTCQSDMDNQNILAIVEKFCQKSFQVLTSNLCKDKTVNQKNLLNKLKKNLKVIGSRLNQKDLTLEQTSAEFQKIIKEQAYLLTSLINKLLEADPLSQESIKFIEFICDLAEQIKIPSLPPSNSTPNSNSNSNPDAKTANNTTIDPSTKIIITKTPTDDESPTVKLLASLSPPINSPVTFKWSCPEGECATKTTNLDTALVLSKIKCSFSITINVPAHPSIPSVTEIIPSIEGEEEDDDCEASLDTSNSEEDYIDVDTGNIKALFKTPAPIKDLNLGSRGY